MGTVIRIHRGLFDYISQNTFTFRPDPNIQYRGFISGALQVGRVFDQTTPVDGLQYIVWERNDMDGTLQVGLDVDHLMIRNNIYVDDLPNAFFVDNVENLIRGHNSLLNGGACGLCLGSGNEDEVNATIGNLMAPIFYPA